MSATAGAEQHQRARELREQGLSYSEISAQLGVHRVTAKRWLNPDLAAAGDARKREAASARRNTKDSTRREVEEQAAHDRARPSPLGVLAARARALADTHRALNAREPGAHPAFKAGLIDLAAICEVVAESIDVEEDPFAELPERGTVPA